MSERAEGQDGGTPEADGPSAKDRTGGDRYGHPSAPAPQAAFPGQVPVGASRHVPPCRILVTGASGTGTSTLGRLLAIRLASQHFDTDDFYWHPTDPPFRAPRPPAERLALMEAMFLPRRDWVLSGAPMRWEGRLRERVTAVIFLRLDPGERMERLRRRERLRYGDAADCPETAEFLAWAESYDDPFFTGRSLAGHLAWLETFACPVTTLDAALPPDRLMEISLSVLDPSRASA